MIVDSQKECTYLRAPEAPDFGICQAQAVIACRGRVGHVTNSLVAPLYCCFASADSAAEELAILTIWIKTNQFCPSKVGKPYSGYGYCLLKSHWVAAVAVVVVVVAVVVAGAAAGNVSLPGSRNR